MQSTNYTRTSNPNAKSTNENGQEKHSGLMRYGMMLCCAIMLIPVGLFFIGGGALSSLSANARLFLPLALCLGMHFVMHRMMGKSCHGKKHEEDNEIKLLEHVKILPAETSR